MKGEAESARDAVAHVAPSVLDRALVPVHRAVWRDPRRRATKLLAFADTEADGGRDIARAAELTKDGLLRRLYLRHALDEQRHAALFRARGRAILATLPAHGDVPREVAWLAPGERGLDDLDVARQPEEALLAFLHLSERAAARRFAVYHGVLTTEDPDTARVFERVLKDELFHMNYTHAQLRRAAPRKYGARLWLARLTRLWKAYLRVATAVASVLGGAMLLLQYFLVLPVFALLAKRAARRAPAGFVNRTGAAPPSLASQFR